MYNYINNIIIIHIIIHCINIKFMTYFQNVAAYTETLNIELTGHSPFNEKQMQITDK